MSGLIQDLRFALRSLTSKPGFTLLSVGVLALAIGATTAIFCLLQAVLLRPLPFDEAEKVVVLSRTFEGTTESIPFSYPTIEDVTKRNRAFEDMAVFVTWNLNLTGLGGDPERLTGLLVAASFPAALGVKPTLGRGFTAADDHPGADRSIMISHELWSRRFGADEAVLGQTITLDGQLYTVVGVLPPKLKTRTLGTYPLGDFWAPIELFKDQIPYSREESAGLLLVGRLKPEVGLDAGREDLDRLSRELGAEHVLLGRSKISAVELYEDSVGSERPTLQLLAGAAGFTLLIACINLANLFLGRGAHRQREFATRSAVGASRIRLVRQVFTETAWVGLLGGVGGVLLAELSIDALAAKVSPETVGFAEASLDGQALLFAALVLIVTILAVGIVPALQASGSSFQNALRVRSQQSGQRLERILVGVEIAVSLVLLIGTFLTLSSLMRLQNQDPGFDPANVLSAQVKLPMPKYSESWKWVGFFDRAIGELSDLPGVRGVAVTSRLPMTGGEASSPVAAADRPLPKTQNLSRTNYQMVSPGFFNTMSIPLLSGRDFGPNDDDRRDAPHVVVISQTLARHFWPASVLEPLGQRIAFELKGTVANPEFVWREVVGVVGDVRSADLRSASGNAVYVPYTQPGEWFVGEWPPMALVIKAEGDPIRHVQPTRSGLLRVDAEQPIHGVRSLDEVLDAQLTQVSTVFTLLSASAILALILATVGVYGLVAQAVANRHREIGTRIALGASPGRIVGEILRQNAVFIVCGLAVGLMVASAVSRSLSSWLYGIGSLDPVVYSAAAVALGLTAILACWIPARRAARIDPGVALRDN